MSEARNESDGLIGPDGYAIHGKFIGSDSGDSAESSDKLKPLAPIEIIAGCGCIFLVAASLFAAGGATYAYFSRPTASPNVASRAGVQPEGRGTNDDAPHSASAATGQAKQAQQQPPPAAPAPKPGKWWWPWRDPTPEEIAAKEAEERKRQEEFAAMERQVTHFVIGFIVFGILAGVVATWIKG